MDTFQKKKLNAADGKEPMPYLHDYYNISFYMAKQSSLIKNVLTRMFNSLAEALNLNQGANQLLRIILVIPDSDILKFVNHYTYGVSVITGRCLSWLINNFEREIEAKKEQLRKKKPGSVSQNEPKIIWVKMLDTPNTTYSDLMACRKKFNSILEEILAQKKNHFIIDINDVMFHKSHFRQTNILNARGKERFWDEINRQVEEFEYNKD